MIFFSESTNHHKLDGCSYVQRRPIDRDVCITLRQKQMRVYFPLIPVSFQLIDWKVFHIKQLHNISFSILFEIRFSSLFYYWLKNLALRRGYT